MGSSGAFVLLGITIIGYLIGIAGIIAGILGQAWWVSESQQGSTSTVPEQELGLIKDCRTSGVNTDDSTCTDRKDILKFVEGDELSKGIHFVPVELGTNLSVPKFSLES